MSQFESTTLARLAETGIIAVLRAPSPESAGVGLRPRTMTSAPASSRAFEIPSPRPRPPPVTAAVLPARSKGVLIRRPSRSAGSEGP